MEYSSLAFWVFAGVMMMAVCGSFVAEGKTAILPPGESVVVYVDGVRPGDTLNYTFTVVNPEEEETEDTIEFWFEGVSGMMQPPAGVSSGQIKGNSKSGGYEIRGDGVLKLIWKNTGPGTVSIYYEYYVKRAVNSIGQDENNTTSDGSDSCCFTCWGYALLPVAGVLIGTGFVQKRVIQKRLGLYRKNKGIIL